MPSVLLLIVTGLLAKSVQFLYATTHSGAGLHYASSHVLRSMVVSVPSLPVLVSPSLSPGTP
jgi:hypothetical protein